MRHRIDGRSYELRHVNIRTVEQRETTAIAWLAKINTKHAACSSHVRGPPVAAFDPSADLVVIGCLRYRIS
jgi:hypothetical protein